MGEFAKAFADALARALIAPFRKLFFRWLWRMGEEDRAAQAIAFHERNIQAGKSGNTSELEKDL